MLGKPCDTTGIAAFGLSIWFTFGGLILGPILTFGNLDPIGTILSFHVEANVLEKFHTEIFAFRLIASYWMCLGISQLAVTMFVPTMLFINIYLTCIKHLSNKRLNSFTVFLYNWLFSINQICMDYIRVGAGGLLGVGFLLLAFGNFSILSGWGVLETEVYVMLFLALAFSYDFTLRTLPLAVKVNVMGTGLVKKWKILALNMYSDRLYWTKRARAMLPVALFYGLTKFDKETKSKYFSKLQDLTMSLLLIKL